MKQIIDKTTLLFLLAFVITISIVGLIIYFVLNKKDRKHKLIKEGFEDNSKLKQIDNVIATKFTITNDTIMAEQNYLQQTRFDNPNNPITTNPNNDGESTTSALLNTFNPAYKHTIKLDNTYVIKQLHITDISDDFRIAIKNNYKNKISYVSGLELNYEKITDVFADDSPKFVIMTLNHSNTNNIYMGEPKDIYGNELVGDEIIIYSKNQISNSDNEVYVMGHLENEIFRKHNTAEQIDKELTTNIIITDRTYFEKSVKQTIDIPYGITSIEFTIMTEKRIKVLFQNNYSNNSFTFEGPLPNKEFIITPKYNTIFFHHTLLASNIHIDDITNSSTGNSMTTIGNNNIDNIKLYGYIPSIDDINRFKLEYNLTDVRGSINPDDVCPSLDQYMHDQLSSEIVIDAMEYQDKINMEKMKLANNKASMLTLLEQEEEIEKLQRMVNKIDSLHQQRKHSTNALNALQLRRQMDEVLKLRAVLDNRIAVREQNTINIPVNINKVRVVSSNDEQNTDDNLDVFADIPLSKEDNMKL